MTPIFASKRGFATIQAALQLYAQTIAEIGTPEEGSPLWVIATDNGNFPSMTRSEVETIIQELNQ
jgi:hypothetical protein